jgi:Tfp pilus assembly protein PilO
MTKMRQWTILTVVAVIVVFAAGWFMLVKPQKSKSATLRSQAATQQQNNQVLVTQIAALQQEEKNLPQQQARERKFATQVPNDAAEPTIIRQLSAAADGAGVDLVSMTPGAATPVVSAATAAAPATEATAAASTAGTSSTPAAGATSLAGTATPAGQLVELPISLGITGTFPNVESFFQSLERLPRALLVTGWSLCPEGTAASGAAPAGGGGATCTAPTVPAGKTLAPNALGGTLSAVIFYAPPVAPTAATGTATTPTTTSSVPSTTTTPAPSTSTAATPATTGATTAPAN